MIPNKISSKINNSLESIDFSTNIIRISCALPFFGLIDLIPGLPLKSFLLWLMGFFALVAILIKQSSTKVYSYGLLLLLCCAMISSILLSDRPLQTLLAPDIFWVGPLTLFSVIALGILNCSLRVDLLPRILFIYSTIFSALSVLIEFPALLAGERLVGLTGNSVGSAIYLGAGIIAWYHTYRVKPLRHHQYFALIIVLAIILTQTRSVILPLMLVGLYTLLRRVKILEVVNYFRLHRIQSIVAVCAFVTLMATSTRVYSVSDFTYSLYYRFDLLKQSLALSQYMPPWGFGPGGIATGFSESVTLPPTLQQSADKKFTIESSHNLLVDYVLQYGWLAGILLIFILGYCLYTAVHLMKHRRYSFGLSLFLFLLLQQMVTVSWLETELLLWMSVCLLLYGPGFTRLQRDFVNYKLSLPILALLTLTISTTHLLFDRAYHHKRLENHFAFPLAAAKTELMNGSRYLDTRGVWQHNLEENLHAGYLAADIFVNEDTPVLAAKSGTVIAVRDEGCNGSNQFPNLFVRGKDGFVYYYAHLKPGSIKVSLHDRVKSGQEIARIGPSDCASGSPPHLHFDISYFYTIRSRSDTFLNNLNYVNPSPLLSKSVQ